MHQYALIQFLGLLMAAGFVAGALGEKFGAPRVALYVLVGVFFSEELLGRFFEASAGSWDTLLTDSALSVIAFLLGAEFHVKWLKTRGKSILYGLIGQFSGTIALVALGVSLFCLFTQAPTSWRLAIVLASIAAATAPAATVAVIEEYRSRGPLTSVLFGIVAIDDALAVIVFTIALNVAATSGQAHEFSHIMIEIFGSILIGSLLGGFLGWFGRKIHEDELRLPAILGFIFFTLGAARLLDLSMLLSCMVLGFVSKLMFGNKTEQWLLPMNHIREAVFVVFFTLAGTHFQAHVFAQSIGFIMTYVLLRTGGKIAGAFAGLRLSHAPPKLYQNAGFALLPQAGVSIGLALTAVEIPPLSNFKPLILNTIVGSTILFELVAPIASKLALQRAGEVSRAEHDR